MKTTLCLLLAASMLSACAGSSDHGNAASERNRHEYLQCISNLDDRTPPESYPDPATRREVVLSSCRDALTRFSVMQEQSRTNTCTAAGGDIARCDREAVQQAAADTAKLEHEAQQLIDETSRRGPRSPLR